VDLKNRRLYEALPQGFTTVTRKKRTSDVTGPASCVEGLIIVTEGFVVALYPTESTVKIYTEMVTKLIFHILLYFSYTIILVFDA
jgi:hypothetical protein